MRSHGSNTEMRLWLPRRFSEMLDSFCGRFNTYDEEGNDYDPYTPDMLNRLRRQRNSIVHSEKTVEPMSDDDIKQCIDYICSL